MKQIYGEKNMRYRSTLFSIFSYLFVLFVAISLIGSAQALTIPDVQRGPFQSGKMILVYSGGLHHVHTPGQRFPRLFQRLFVKFEIVDIAEYIEEQNCPGDFDRFRQNVVKDLERRRDLYCPV